MRKKKQTRQILPKELPTTGSISVKNTVAVRLSAFFKKISSIISTMSPVRSALSPFHFFKVETNFLRPWLKKSAPYSIYICLSPVSPVQLVFRQVLKNIFFRPKVKILNFTYRVYLPKSGDTVTDSQQPLGAQGRELSPVHFYTGDKGEGAFRTRGVRGWISCRFQTVGGVSGLSPV